MYFEIPQRVSIGEVQLERNETSMSLVLHQPTAFMSNKGGSGFVSGRIDFGLQVLISNNTLKLSKYRKPKLLDYTCHYSSQCDALRLYVEEHLADDVFQFDRQDLYAYDHPMAAR